MVSEAIIVSHESYLTTFVKGPPPRNGSKYVKNGGFLMPLKWGCQGQEVPDDGLQRFLSGSTGLEDGLHGQYYTFGLDKNVNHFLAGNICYGCIESTASFLGLDRKIDFIHLIILKKSSQC